MDPIVLAGFVGAWLIATNSAAFALFGLDKAKARAGSRRIAESDLLSIAMVGGTIGAFVGRRHFRHKTRKQPFSGQLQTIAILQFAALGGLAVWFW